MVGTSGSEANKADKMRVYVETDLDTALLLTPSQSSTVKALQGQGRIDLHRGVTHPPRAKLFRQCRRAVLGRLFSEYCTGQVMEDLPCR